MAQLMISKYIPKIKLIAFPYNFSNFHYNTPLTFHLLHHIFISQIRKPDLEEKK